MFRVILGLLQTFFLSLGHIKKTYALFLIILEIAFYDFYACYSPRVSIDNVWNNLHQNKQFHFAMKKVLS